MIVYVAHAAFQQARRVNLQALLTQLSPQVSVRVLSSERREPASTWATRLYACASGYGHDDHVFLNDDVRIAPRFVEILHALLESVPRDQPLSLHPSMPEAEHLLSRGRSLVRTYWMSGPAYILRADQPQELLAWWSRAPEFLRRQNEDNWGIVWAWMRRRPFWATLPALVEHDVTIPSAVGHDAHSLRSSGASFRGVDPELLTQPSYWRPPTEEVECPWMPEATRREFEGRYNGHRGGPP